MDSKSGAILASSGAGLVDGLPGSDEQSVETKPLTEIQVHAVDLSLKSPQLLPPYSQPLHLKDTHGFHSEVKKTSRGQKRGRGSMEVEGEDNAIHTTLKPGVLETSVSNPTLPETDSSATSGKDTHHPSPVVLKDEIEEVCIGDSDGDWHEQSYSPVFLNKISTEDKGSDITSDGNDKVPVDTTATIKEEQEDIVMNDFGFLAKDAAQQKPSVSEGHMLDLTGSTKNESVTGLSAKLNQSIRNCSGKNELSDIIQDRNEEGHGKTGKEEASFPFVLPGCSQGLNKIREKTNEPDREEKENIVKQKMDREGEALNLTLSQKSMWNDRHKMEKYSERTGSESTLVMEVDEIVQRVEEEKDDDAQGLLERGSAVKVNVSDWDPNKSPALDSLRRSPTSSTPEDLDGLLLIDDQGIPYTLTPDGEKVIQVAPSKSCKASTFGQTKLRAKHVEVNDSMAVSSPDCDLPKKSLTETRPCVTSKHVTPQLTTSGSASKIVPHPNNTSTTQTAVITPASLSPTLSNLASQPVQILANPTSNILLVPSSHLPSPSSSTPTSNASLLTLSLPISLNPNPPSAPLFLVLSPLTASSTSPSSSNVNAIDSIPSSLLPTKTQSSASAPVPLSSGKTVIGSSSPSTASLPADTLNSSAPSTCIAGEMSGSISTPNFSSVSSGNTKQPKPDLACKTVFSKSSIVTKSDSPCNPDSAFDAENQTDSSTSPVPISPVKIPKSNTSPSTSTPFVPQGSQDSSLPVDQPSPTSDTQADIFPSDQSLYSSSGMPPPMAIFPTNHPKNFSLSSACPRRILYCQYCPRAFYYLSDLERHSITHSQSKPHVCPLCSKAFKRSSHLERHKHIHTGQRNFICPICSKRFREAGELHRHQRVHTGEKPFQCSLCHMRFAERNTLRRHTKRKHHEFNGHGDGDGMPGGPEESAEWYSCAVPDMDSDTEPDKD